MIRTPQEWVTIIDEKFFSGQKYDYQAWARQFPNPPNKIVVHIPARAGSTRLNGKNIRQLCGVPLLAYTILVAKALPVDRVIVNTNNSEYTAIAEKYGAEVPFLRPEELSDNYISPGLAAYYAKRHLMAEGYPMGTFIDMYPTSPFRNVTRMQGYLDKLLRHGHCETCISPEMLGLGLYRNTGRIVDGTTGKMAPETFFFKILSIFMGQKFSAPVPEPSYCYPYITDPVELIDIDDESDILLAEKVIESGLYNFGTKIC